MTILQQASGSFNGTGSMTLTLPAASSASNTVVAIIAGNTVVTTPAGWTLRTSQVNQMGHYLYDRTGGSTTYTFAFSGTASLTWWIAEIPGAATFDKAASANDATGSGIYSTPSLTPAAGTRLVVASLGSTLAGTVRTISGWTNGFVEQADVCQPTQDYPMQGVAVLDNLAANGTTAYTTQGTYSATSGGRSAVIGSWATSAAQANTPPTANAGADQSVEPFATVSITGVGTDAEQTPTLSLAQTAGPAVTLARTGNTWKFEAPGVEGGTNLTFRLSVSDGTTTVTDDVTVTVAAPTLFRLSGSVWVPQPVFVI